MAEIYDDHASRTVVSISPKHERGDSPTYLGGNVDVGSIRFDPARLVWGLAETVERLGGVIHHNEQAICRRRRLQSAQQRASRCHRVIVATNAFAEPVRQMRRYIVGL